MNATFQDIYHAQIKPLGETTKRPLWTVLIPTYNCAQYLRETLASVLQQDPGKNAMEIIVVDDCSTKDNPQAVVEELGKGRVEFIKQAKNVGKVKNYETGLQRAKGIYIHQLHGDDKVLPGFYTEIERIFKENPTAGAAFCRTLYIDGHSRWTGLTGMIQNTEGIIHDMAEKLYVEQYIQTPSMVLKREVYENLGGFDRRLNCMEDWEMWTRVANFYPVACSNKVLAEYRSHPSNATNITFADGSALDTHLLVYQIVDAYINKDIPLKKRKEKQREQAQFLMLSISDRKKTLKTSAKLKMALQALQLHFSLKSMYRILKAL